MISNLLTALGVAALSIQTPSNIQPQEPKRAYYDSSAVANYGTTNGKIYNYTSSAFYEEDTNYHLPNMVGSNTISCDINESTSYSLQTGSRTLLINDYDDIYITLNSIDVYVDGTLATEITCNEATGGDIPYCWGTNGFALKINNSDHYIWVFDHQEPNMSETIAEVVGDATTAAGAVLGSGISGAIALFYNEGITGLGIIALILTGVSLVWFAFSLILRLWRRR